MNYKSVYFNEPSSVSYYENNISIFNVYIYLFIQIQLIIMHDILYYIEIGRLDKVVNDVYDYYVDRFDSGDLVTCRWTDGVKYVT